MGKFGINPNQINNSIISREPSVQYELSGDEAYMPIFEEDVEILPESISDAMGYTPKRMTQKQISQKYPSYQSVSSAFKKDKNGAIDMNQFTKKSLENKYGDDYTVLENKDYIAVWQTHNSDRALLITKESNGSLTLDYDTTQKSYNITAGGELTYFKDNRKNLAIKYTQGQIYQVTDGQTTTNPALDTLVTTLKNPMKCTLSTVKTNLTNTVTKMISSSNAIDILDGYKQQTGRDLLVDLRNVCTQAGYSEKEISKLTKHIENCFYNPSYKNDNSQISNKYYKGDSYSIKQNNNIITVVNKRTNKTTTLDLKTLCGNMTSTKSLKLLQCIQTLPGEVLEDLAYEATFKIEDHNNHRSFFSYDDDSIHLDNESFNAKSIIHELGHAIDFISTGGVMSDNAVKNSFNKELQKFEADGNTRHSEEWSKKSRTYSNRSKGTVDAYATWNTREMFAECYTLLMTGDCTSKNVIEKYFPETLANVEKAIKQVRNSGPASRRTPV